MAPDPPPLFDPATGHDRMVALVLAQPLRDAPARGAAWRQLVDLSAQAGDALAPAFRARLDAAVLALRHAVPDAARRAVAGGLGARVRDAATVRAFAGDLPAIAAPVLAQATLTATQWLELLPNLPPSARAILRNRRDLPTAVTRALAAFGPGDVALETTAVAAGVAGSQIVELVARIEAFRSQAPIARVADPAGAPEPAFVFEIDRDGIIDWVDGSVRAHVVGLSVAEEALPRSPGVDGQAAGAFRRRAPITAARLVVVAGAQGQGVWLISAAPMFDPRTGRFAGYHGTGRRPRADEVAGAPPTGPATLTAIDPDALRQIVHELRTPLNAVQGFAEMIDAQMLGPVSQPYRDRAAVIVGDARALLQVVDDLDTAARLDGNRLDAADDGVMLGDVVTSVAADLDALAHARGARLAVSAAAVTVPGSAMLVDRVVRRLASNAVALAAPGETVAIVTDAPDGAGRVAITRPAMLTGVADHVLLDPDFGPDGEWPDAPLLGLGFTIRLVDRIARELGAKLTIERDQFRIDFAAGAARDQSVPAS